MRDEDHGGVEGLQLALEPLEARDVEVVRRLVEEQQVGIAAECARERRARQLSARERAQRAVEMRFGESEAAQHRGGVIAPAVAACMLEPRLRGRVSVERRLIVRAAGHRLLQAGQLFLEPHEVARAGQDVLAQRHVLLERRPLIVQRDARPFLERELAAVHLGLAREHPEQRRLAGAVRAGKRDAIAALDAEGDAVEEDRAGELLAQVGGDDDCHCSPRVDSPRGDRARARCRLVLRPRAGLRRTRRARRRAP